jgi:hypothetical protein
MDDGNINVRIVVELEYVNMKNIKVFVLSVMGTRYIHTNVSKLNVMNVEVVHFVHMDI